MSFSECSDEFEVSKIKDHLILDDDHTLFHVEWKPTIVSSTDALYQWLNQIKSITKIYLNDQHIDNMERKEQICKYKVQWKDTWLPKESLTGCDVFLPAYTLLNLRRQSETIIEDHKFRTFCKQQLEDAVYVKHEKNEWNSDDVAMYDIHSHRNPSPDTEDSVSLL
eukprot:528170_1